MAHRIKLPDLLANWKWPRQINPHYEEVKQASAAWLAGFGAFSPRAQQAFDACDFSLLASLAYPRLAKEHLRTGCDLMNLFFVIDEYTDVATETEAREMARIVMDAIYNPERPRPAGEWIGGEIARQFWHLATKTLSRSAARRFRLSFDDHLDAVVTQAADRDTQRFHTTQSYLEVRRRTIGAAPSFAILQADMDIPDVIINFPQMTELTEVVTEMICIGNDIVSYNKEQSVGDEHNIVAIVMKQLELEPQEALAWVAGHFETLESRFNSAWNSVPRYGGPVDLQVLTYMDGLANWVRANDQWSFESERYFGTMGLEIMMTRSVGLIPRHDRREIGPEEVIKVFL